MCGVYYQKSDIENKRHPFLIAAVLKYSDEIAFFCTLDLVNCSATLHLKISLFSKDYNKFVSVLSPLNDMNAV